MKSSSNNATSDSREFVGDFIELLNRSWNRYWGFECQRESCSRVPDGLEEGYEDIGKSFGE
jgi:hypothetical protein